MTEDITLVRVTTEPAKKCAYCSFRATERWKFGAGEPDDSATCNQCTLHLLKDKQANTSENKLTIGFTE